MQGAIKAFDVNTGAEKWSWNGDGPGYGSPIVVELGGTRQLVTITQGKLVSLDPATGALLWERPYVSSNFTNAVTPVLYGQTLIVSGNGGPTVAVAVKKQNNQWVTENAWENADIPYRLSNSVLVGDALFGLSSKNSGQYFSVDAKTSDRGRRIGDRIQALGGLVHALVGRLRRQHDGHQQFERRSIVELGLRVRIARAKPLEDRAALGRIHFALPCAICASRSRRFASFAWLPAFTPRTGLSAISSRSTA
jgi:hypothetical protein